MLSLGTDVESLSWPVILHSPSRHRVSEGLLVVNSTREKQLVLAKEARLTKAKRSWSRNGSRLDRCGGVEASHQETIEGYAGGDGY